MAAQKSGQVQGGNAQEGRRLRNQRSQYRAAAICWNRQLYASAKTHFLKLLAKGKLTKSKELLLLARCAWLHHDLCIAQICPFRMKTPSPRQVTPL
jgi:hypothetical protein